jgi:hypothetical protein
MHYSQLITGKNKKNSYNFFIDYLLSIDKRVKNICIRIRIDIRMSFHHSIKI